jgi:hypothetical protein
MPINDFIAANLKSNKKPFLSDLIADPKNEIAIKIKVSIIKRRYI